MMCEKCGKNPATTHVKTIINGEVTEKNLCSLCAAADGYSGFGTGGFFNMLSSFFGDTLQSGMPTGKRCAKCGTSFEEIAETGRAGCPDCYREFETEFRPSIVRIHGDSKHCGKVPLKASPEVKKAANIRELKEKLAKAIESEEYEKAAELRDKIKEQSGDDKNE